MSYKKYFDRDRNSEEIRRIFDTPIFRYVDGDGYISLMKWIPPFTACRALTSTAAVATPSGTVGDWFHPSQIQSSWVLDTDYEICGLRKRLTSGTLTVGKHYRIATYNSDDDFTNVGCPRNATGQCFIATGTTPTHWEHSSVLMEEEMGGYWVDMYLCSSPSATATSYGSICDGSAGKRAYISKPLVAPICSANSSSLTISHFRQYLAARFNNGGFLEYGETSSGTAWAGKGGLITDAHWFELWIWTRINRWLLRGNTNGYNASNKIPQWHLDSNDIGLIDPTQASNGASLTGGGSKLWEVPVSDFCGNRWEFADGLRLYNGAIYTAYKTINPYDDPADGYNDERWVNTGLSVSGVTFGQSITSYRTENALKRHGIAASTTTAGQGGFDGQGWWHDSSNERIAIRGGYCLNEAQCPGALGLVHTPSIYHWSSGARAVLVP